MFIFTLPIIKYLLCHSLSLSFIHTHTHTHTHIQQSFSVQIATIQRGAKGLFKKMRNRKHTSSDGGGLKESELSMSESQDDFHPERDEDNDSDASSDYDVVHEYCCWLSV